MGPRHLDCELGSFDSTCLPLSLSLSLFLGLSYLVPSILGSEIFLVQRLRMDIRRELKIPDPADLVQEGGGSISFPDHIKWSEIASKASMIAQTSGNPGKQLQEKIDAVREDQGKLALVMKQALIKAIHDSVQHAQEALKNVVFCFERFGPDFKVDWLQHAGTLQKMSEINVRILFGFDLMGTLGAECGKEFTGEVERMLRLFHLLSLLANWLKLNHGWVVCIVNFGITV